MDVLIIEDKGQQDKKHELKHQYFAEYNIMLQRYPLPVGDYIVANDQVMDVIARKKKRNIEVKKMDFLGTYAVCVDTKKDIQEIIGNICGKQHERFRDECILAHNNGIQLFVLVENDDGVSSLDNLSMWVNPRSKMQKWVTTPNGERRKVLLSPKATNGDTLSKAMSSMEKKYGVRFFFCRPEESGETILKLLGVDISG